MYKLTNSTSILRVADCAFIPPDEANPDFILYTQWLLEGNAPQPADIPTPTTAAANKATASSLLAGTDWTTIADIALPTSNPRLGNQSEFIAYRNTIRAIAVYPPAGDIVWATPPTEVWEGE